MRKITKLTSLNIFYIFILLFPGVILGGIKSVYELNGSLGYSKQVYGDQRQNSFVQRSYTGSFAVFFLTYTAIEATYSQEEDIITENDEIEITDTASIVSIQNKVLTKVYGLGIKQSLANLKSLIVPMLAIGHAKQMKSGGTNYTISETAGNRIIQGQRSEKSVDSTFASFTLKLNLSRRVALTGMVKTIVPSFEWSKARDSIKYEAGISVLF